MLLSLAETALPSQAYLRACPVGREVGVPGCKGRCAIPEGPSRTLSLWNIDDASISTGSSSISARLVWPRGGAVVRWCGGGDYSSSMWEAMCRFWDQERIRRETTCAVAK